jgi:glycine cleavage system H protein
MARIQDEDYPEHLLYDIDNQIWYEPLADGRVRAGFTPIAVSLAGEVLVFTPKRIGRAFEKGRSFATIECGKWVGAARAAFEGVVEAHNEALVQKPELLNQDAFGKGWMLIVRPKAEGWRAGLITGKAIASAFGEWIASEAYKDRTE